MKSGVFIFSMKKLIPILSVLLFTNCSKENVNPPSDSNDDDDKVVDIQISASDDYVNTSEDTAVSSGNVMNNDTFPEGTRINSYDETSLNGAEIIDNRDGSFTYTPENSFTGEDSFSYTICDTEKDAACSTANVNILVEDEGNPTAVDDNINVVFNTPITLTNLIDNDTVLDDAKMFSVDSTSSSGSAVLNDDLSVTYTPQSDSTQDDSFVYTICDDDSPSSSCSSANVYVTVLEPVELNVPDDLLYYYEDVIFSTDPSANHIALQNITQANHTTILTYYQRHDFLYDADEDLSNNRNVILMYSGESRYWKEYSSPSNDYSPQTFNSEHVYPQSKLNDENSLTDLHNLRVCDENVNTQKSNFGFVDSSGDYKKINQGWYPGDEWKGDVARMIFYLNIRYDEIINDIGTIELFQKWNIEDPVSDFERQRNSVIEQAQGNRNPFIDNPYLVTLVWGGEDAENIWE